MAGLDPAIHPFSKEHLAKTMDARAFAAPKGFGPAGGSSPA
jgi:hypothetical protein